VIAALLNLRFIWGAIGIVRRDEAMAEADNYKAEKAFFRYSLGYLFMNFGALLVEASLRSFGMVGW
jgi:protoheme IX farnesyltransferase